MPDRLVAAAVGYQSALAPGWETDYVKPTGQPLTGRPGAILVDQSGVRYLNEGGSYELYCQKMIERNRTVPAVPSWVDTFVNVFFSWPPSELTTVSPV